MYKLIAIDVDGTLLNEKKELSIETAEAIQYAQSKGVDVTISTGRSISGIIDYVKKLNINLPLITFNGAKVIEPITEEVVYSRLLDYDDSVKLIELSDKVGIDYLVWAGNKLFSRKLSEPVKDYSLRYNCPAHIVEDFTEALEYGITKFLWFSTIEEIEGVKAKVEGKVPTTVSYFTSRPDFLEFINAKVSKGVALSQLAEQLGYKQEEVIAIGDGENDLEMIQYAGLGVAMGNAKQIVKDNADMVTLDNNNNGVAEVIRRHIR
jgi:Cof subfamily protein (haloacid dehalogenase superfamily)